MFGKKCSSWVRPILAVAHRVLRTHAVCATISCVFVVYKGGTLVEPVINCPRGIINVKNEKNARAF